MLIIFLILNIGFIAVWVSKTAVKKEEPVVNIVKGKDSAGKKYGNYLVKKLNMDSTQAKVYFKLKREHSKKMRETYKQIDSLRLLLGKQVFSEEQDSAIVAKLIKQITVKKMEFEWDNINHLKDIKSILTEEQRIKFDDVHREMMMKMKSRGGPPFRGRHGKQ